MYIARVDNGDPGYEHDLWMKRTKPTEDEQEPRADRWYYKNMDKLRDNPEQSGMYCTIVPTFNAWLIQVFILTVHRLLRRLNLL